MKQQTFSDYEYANRRRKTRRDLFLEKMDALIPWEEWVEWVRPVYPAGRRGRPPKDLETMLRMFLLQNWYLLTGEGIEDAIYDSFAMRNFVRVDFLTEQVPDATTLLRFRQLLEKHDLDAKITADLRERLRKEGYILLSGQSAEASIIAVNEDA